MLKKILIGMFLFSLFGKLYSSTEEKQVKKSCLMKNSSTGFDNRAVLAISIFSAARNSNDKTESVQLFVGKNNVIEIDGNGTSKFQSINNPGLSEVDYSLNVLQKLEANPATITFDKYVPFNLSNLSASVGELNKLVAGNDKAVVKIVSGTKVTFVEIDFNDLKTKGVKRAKYSGWPIRAIDFYDHLKRPVSFPYIEMPFAITNKNISIQVDDKSTLYANIMFKIMCR
jgi:hypothetical protein